MGHIHAAAMAEYAKDALETDKPWERWEASFKGQEVYFALENNPCWGPGIEYRRKPRTILINGHEVLEPCRTPLQCGEHYWIPDLFGGAIEYCWEGDIHDDSFLNDGFIHLTEEAAVKHYNALRSFTAKRDYD